MVSGRIAGCQSFVFLHKSDPADHTRYDQRCFQKCFGFGSGLQHPIWKVFWVLDVVCNIVCQSVLSWPEMLLLSAQGVLEVISKFFFEFPGNQAFVSKA